MLAEFEGLGHDAKTAPECGSPGPNFLNNSKGLESEVYRMRAKNTAIVALRKHVPAWARPGLVLLSREQKRPIEKGFTTQAASWYQGNGWSEKERLAQLAIHIDGGGNVGWVPHPDMLVVDCDNEFSVTIAETHAPSNTPRMIRREDKQHFYFRNDYSKLRAYKKPVQVTMDRGSVAKFDIITPGDADPAQPAGGQCVMPPSIHPDDPDNPYTWAKALPKKLESVPTLPDELADIFRPHFQGKKSKARTGDSRHLRSLKYQRRLAIEADMDTPEVRDAIREASAEFLADLYEGDAVRLKAEVEDLDRQLDGAYGLEGAFQGFVRDGTAESVAQEIKSSVEGGIAFVTEEKEWREFDNVVWGASSEWRVKQIIGDYYKEYLADAAIEEDDDHYKLLIKIALALKGVKFVEDVYRRMKANLHCSLAEFDTSLELVTFPDSEELNVGAVTYNVRTGETMDPEASHRITHTAGVPYVPGATHPTVDAYWESSFPVIETRDCTQMHLGMSLLGWIPEERIYFMHGSAASGKGTLANATKICFGGYGIECDPSTWSGHGGIDGSRNAPDLAALRGKRFCFVDEISPTRVLGARAKALSQDGFITAAAKYKSQSEFPITWTPWIAGNARPKIDSTDKGLLRRIVEIPMNAGSPTPNNPDWHIKDTLKRDLRAQVAWMWKLVEGLNEARKHDFRPPISQEMKEATQDWIESADLIGDWWVERIEVTGKHTDFESASELLAAYEAWMDDLYGFRSRQDVPRANKMQFASALKARGIQKHKSHGKMVYRGLRLKRDEDILQEGLPVHDKLPKLPN